MSNSACTVHRIQMGWRSLTDGQTGTAADPDGTNGGFLASKIAANSKKGLSRPQIPICSTVWR